MRLNICSVLLVLACAPSSMRDGGVVDGGFGGSAVGGGSSGGGDAGTGVGDAGAAVDAGVDAGFDPCLFCPRGSVCGQEGCLFLCGECRENAECGRFSCSSRLFCVAPLADCSLASERPDAVSVKYSSDQCSPLVGNCSINVGLELASGVLRAEFVGLDGGMSTSRELSATDLALVGATRFSCVDAGFWQEYPLGCVAHDWQLSVFVRHPSGATTAFDLYRGQARRPPLAVDDVLDLLLLRALDSFVDAGVL